MSHLIYLNDACNDGCILSRNHGALFYSDYNVCDNGHDDSSHFYGHNNAYNSEDYIDNVAYNAYNRALYRSYSVAVYYNVACSSAAYNNALAYNNNDVRYTEAYSSHAQNIQ